MDYYYVFIFIKNTNNKIELRVARHTNDINKILDFYTKIIGLNLLGEFKNHNNYDGIFVGKKK
ncbi:hypothetical protein [Chishuiella sp.]|uniref:hypothetical protein n=1 Tax=Chishuiella sp. TaxID=1969467 RepID=UPI003917FF1D